MEGFVKALKKNSLNDVKRYYFYLTYNNRADLEMIFNKPQINEMSEINKIVSEGKLNNKNTLNTSTPYSTYYSYRNELRNEWKSNRTKQLELIMSYSKIINEFMFHVFGQENWEKEYREIIIRIMKKHFSKNRHISCYFHKFDSTGYRYHTHILIYPYENNTNGFPIIYNHIEPEKLNKIKKDFSEELKELIKRRRDFIKSKVVKILKNQLKKQKLVEDNELFNIYLEKNKEIKNLF